MNTFDKMKNDKEIDAHTEIQKSLNKKEDSERFLEIIASEYLGVYIVNRKTGLFRNVIEPDLFHRIIKGKDGLFVEAMRVYKDLYVKEDCYSTINFLLDLDNVYEILESEEEINVSYTKKDGSVIDLQIKPYSNKENDKDLSIWIYKNENQNNKKREYERQKQLSDALKLAKKTNDQLKEAIHLAKTEKRTLEKLCTDFVSMYAVEVNTGKFEILKLEPTTNARILVDKENYQNFNAYVKDYCDKYVIEEDKKSFEEWFSCENLKERLSTEDRILFYYQSNPNKGGKKFFEAQAVKSYVDDAEFNVFIGLRYIDDLIMEEKQKQKILQDALDEANLKNEIISAIGKTYQYISRIDLENNYYEELTGLNEFHLENNKKGNPSENARVMCEKRVAKEYQEGFKKFTDMSTLAGRLQDKEMIDYEYQVNDGDWHIMWFIVKKRDSFGRVTHVLCTIRSISKRKREEQKLMLLADEARKDAAMKTRFLSNMSHDIRTPMNGIIGLLDKANRYPNDLDVQKECRTKIMDLSQSLVVMVNDILEINKLEADENSDLYTSFDIAELLRMVNEDAQLKADKKRINYVVDWGNGVYSHRYLLGNPYYCRRILQILADNAIKFSEEGSDIHVWINEEMVDDEHSYFTFVCQDQGIGMDEEFISHAFEIFSQEKETNRTNYEGSGLGLAIAKKMADRMNGEITLESEKGKGTKASFRVLFTLDKKGDEISGEKDIDISLEGIRILVAEDNMMNVEIIKFILEENNILVEIAENGEKAVSMFKDSSEGYYDVILMDILMPVMNGLDATRKIRTLNRNDSKIVPIIAMSANTFADDIMRSYIAGVDYYLAKPIGAEKVITTIKKYLSKKKASQS